MSSDEQEHSKNARDDLELARPAPGFLRRSFDDGPVIIAGVAGFAKQGDPAVWIIVEFGGQYPFLEQRLLLRCSIRIDLHEGASGCEAFDFTERDDAFGAISFVHGCERYSGLEG